jgi:DNA-binding MarR family transcriptional regulator
VTGKSGPKAPAEESAVSLWHQILRCYKSIERNISSRMQDNYQQSLSRFDILTQLHSSDEEWISVGELARRLVDTREGISALLTRMEKEDLISRRLNPSDRRSFQVAITKKGSALYKNISSDYSTWVAYALEDVSSKERKLLLEILGRVKEAQTRESR